MICSNCNKEYPDSQTGCPYCEGNAELSPAQTPAIAKRKPTKAVIITICMVLLLAATIGAVLYFTSSSPEKVAKEFMEALEDGDYKAIRYINHENDGRVFKMKAGKFFRALILETKFGQTLPEQVLIYLCEDFATEWQGYCIGKLPKNKLHVNEDFERIYSSEHLLENFGSCMVNRGLHGFYEYAVKAKAAYLENEEGKTKHVVAYAKAELGA